MRVTGYLVAFFGASGLLAGIVRVLEHKHVEPISLALVALMMVGGVLLARAGGVRARAAAERGPEIVVLAVARKHGGRVTPVLVAAEAGLAIEAAERELATLAARGACVRGADDFVFPELENEAVKRKLFFADGQKVRS